MVQMRKLERLFQDFQRMVDSGSMCKSSYKNGLDPGPLLANGLDHGTPRTPRHHQVSHHKVESSTGNLTHHQIKTNIPNSVV